MHLLQSFVFSALATLVGSAAVPRQQPAQYDAIIIGGGPAGLAALSGLARVRRNVLLIDSGEYRNGPTRHMHDVLGFDGVTPAWYRYGARQQLQHYDTITMTNGTVTKIEPAENNTIFTVTTVYEDKSEKAITARKVVLATGLRDILPDTPGVEENWGEGIYWCPWCDGHEHEDQPLGFLAPFDQVPGMVREILTLNTDIVAFVNGTDTPAVREATTKKETGDWEAFLKIHGVRIENRTISEIVRLKNGTTGDEDPSLPSVAEFDSFNVEFTEGDPVERAAFFASFKDEQASDIGTDVGVKLWGGRLAVDPTKGLVTNVPGIYAIGDANSDNVTNVPHALFSGKRTAVYLHVQLARENEAIELENYKDAPSKRDLHVEARELWDTVNGQPGELLYAGNFDHGL